jgi:phytoene dehydrogenase-like protein
VKWIRDNGGEVIYRQEVSKIIVRDGQAVGVETAKGLDLPCDYLIANLTPWNLAELLGESAPRPCARKQRNANLPGALLPSTWGWKASVCPAGIPDHHQVVVDPSQPLGEGNSIFLSLSPLSTPPAHRRPCVPPQSPPIQRSAVGGTGTRKPAGLRRTRADYIERVLQAAERAVPGLRGAVKLCLPGTPVTFQFYTRRSMGMVGGFPQTSLLRARGPSTGIPNLWLVGDSIFPGQSTAGTTLGGWRVAEEVLRARTK